MIIILREKLGRRIFQVYEDDGIDDSICCRDILGFREADRNC